ncbi:hypothetical protein [Paraburkholderia phosphatilytica]|uniref:hypothetical protein n=1 Tax=Paraburkholderia phosphatilytica TaxID=2282883 RepID=UPI000E5289A2|nr:hypothetical protein [Paraburkholderia phosphatilytica]
MTTTQRLYRGLEFHALVYPHHVTPAGFSHNYEEGFDASVRISEPEVDSAPLRSRVFRVSGERPFSCTGEARRACTRYAEWLIDESDRTGKPIWDRS